MASPELGLTASRHRTLFRKVAETMRFDGTLGRVINSWIVWDGSDIDRLEESEISAAHCPLCWLAPSRGPDGWYGPDSYLGPLVIKIGLVVTGTDVDDLLDLYQAVIDSVWPDDSTARETINNAFVTEGAQAYALQQFTQPSFGFVGVPDAPLLMASGQLMFPVSTGVNP